MVMLFLLMKILSIFRFMFYAEQKPMLHKISPLSEILFIIVIFSITPSFEMIRLKCILYHYTVNMIWFLSMV